MDRGVADASMPVSILAEARRITSSSAGANTSGDTAPTATYPGSSPSAIEIWFQRRKGDVVGRTMKRRLGSGNAKYADQTQSVRQIAIPFTILTVESIWELCESQAERTNSVVARKPSP